MSIGLGARAEAAAHVLRRPAFVVALVVLLLNDRWWKAAWPGVLTGKLSDVAGVFVAAVLLGAVAVLVGVSERRSSVSASFVVGALFSLMKTTTWGAEAAEAAWTLVNGGPNGVVADPTDLVALPALLLVPRRFVPPRRSGGSRHRTAGRGPVPVIAALVLASAGLFATTATASCRFGPQVERIRHDGDWLLAVDDSGDPLAWSDDAGATWTDAAGPNDPAVPTGRFGPDPRADRPYEDAPDACFGDDCWRAAGGELVHVEGDDTSGVLAAVSDQRTGCDQGSENVRSVEAVTTASGQRMVVASMGAQGVAIASFDGKELGEWERRAVGGTSIPSGFGESWPPRWLWLAGSIVSLVFAGVIGSSYGRARRRGGETLFSFFVGVVAFALASVSLLGGLLLSTGFAEATGFRLAAGVVLAVGYGLLVAVVRSLSGPKVVPDVAEPA